MEPEPCLLYDTTMLRLNTANHRIDRVHTHHKFWEQISLLRQVLSSME